MWIITHIVAYSMYVTSFPLVRWDCIRRGIILEIHIRTYFAYYSFVSCLWKCLFFVISSHLFQITSFSLIMLFIIIHLTKNGWILPFSGRITDYIFCEAQFFHRSVVLVIIDIMGTTRFNANQPTQSFGMNNRGARNTKCTKVMYE